MYKGPPKILYNISRKKPVDPSGSPDESSGKTAFPGCHPWWSGLFIYTTAFDSSMLSDGKTCL